MGRKLTSEKWDFHQNKHEQWVKTENIRWNQFRKSNLMSIWNPEFLTGPYINASFVNCFVFMHFSLSCKSHFFTLLLTLTVAACITNAVDDSGALFFLIFPSLFNNRTPILIISTKYLCLHVCFFTEKRDLRILKEYWIFYVLYCSLD